MRRVSYSFIVALFFCVHTMADRFSAKTEELRNETIYKPVDCIEKSKRFNFLTVHYNVSNSHGKLLASSLEKNEPVRFQIWKLEVIEGLDVGLLEMCVGEKRRLFVTEMWSYPGAVDKIVVPPESILIYEVELLKIEKVTHPVIEGFEKADANSDMQVTRDELSAYWTESVKRMDENDELEGRRIQDILAQRESIIDSMFEDDDVNKDGIITYEEFLHRWKDEL